MTFPRDPDPYHFAKMLDDELRRVQEGVATGESIQQVRETWMRGRTAIAAGEYDGYLWHGEDFLPRHEGQNPNCFVCQAKR